MCFISTQGGGGWKLYQVVSLPPPPLTKLLVSLLLGRTNTLKAIASSLVYEPSIMNLNRKLQCNTLSALLVAYSVCWALRRQMPSFLAYLFFCRVALLPLSFLEVKRKC